MSPRKPRRSQERHELLTSKYIHGRVEAQQEALHMAGIALQPPLLNSIANYIELLLRWNRKINLTTITDPDEILTRNFVESFLAAKWLPEEIGTLCDVGSGAGFPGLALKLLLPQWKAVLLEPAAKKTAFLAEAARTLGLRDVEIRRSRWEDSDLPQTSVDAITARAVGGYPELVEWAKGRLKPGGRLALWLGAEDAVILAKLTGWEWSRETLPNSRERELLIGTPC